MSGALRRAPRRLPRKLLATLACAAASAALAPVDAQAQTSQPTASACAQLSPIAAPCTLIGKAAESAAAACRAAGVPDTRCVLPLAKSVTAAARDAYLRSAVHRNAVLQYRLGDALPLGQAAWLGTHNSFNSPSATPATVSHSDSNQQLSLTQQLDVDMRALELDLHYLPRPGAPGGRAVIVCHGQGPSNLDAGCTTEAPFAEVLAPIAQWLKAPEHADEVVLLYLEDELQNGAAYPSAVATLEQQLRRPDGSSLIYHPDTARKAANGCTPMPLDVSRAQIRATGARVVLVGNCAKGWSGDVFDWRPTHVESGDTAAYRPWPACDRTYGRAVYASKLVRYYEDSTFVATVVNPTRAPVDPEALTPQKVAAMNGCGVGLFGFDQLLPGDGRIAASIWSWADGQPAASTEQAGCTHQRADGRWATGSCAIRRRAACVRPSPRTPRWLVTTKAVPFSGARVACRARGARFAVPRSGLQNNQLRAVAQAGEAVWIAHRAGRG